MTPSNFSSLDIYDKLSKSMNQNGSIENALMPDNECYMSFEEGVKSIRLDGTFSGDELIAIGAWINTRVSANHKELIENIKKYENQFTYGNDRANNPS